MKLKELDKIEEKTRWSGYSRDDSKPLILKLITALRKEILAKNPQKDYKAANDDTYYGWHEEEYAKNCNSSSK